METFEKYSAAGGFKFKTDEARQAARIIRPARLRRKKDEEILRFDF